MIPLRDANPSGTRPLVTVALIIANLAAFYHELSLGEQLDRFLLEYGLVPLKVTHFFRVEGLSLTGDVLQPAFASLFLHGGWLHLIGNMWFLWLFGDNIEDRLGHGRFLLFYLLAGIGASATHVYFNPESGAPTIGASGAIAGVLGAYLVCFPRAQILTIVPILFVIQFIELPAFVVLGFWFLLQFFNGFTAISTQMSGGVAWWAHIGGFVLGIALILLLPRNRRSRQLHYASRF